MDSEKELSKKKKRLAAKTNAYNIKSWAQCRECKDMFPNLRSLYCEHDKCYRCCKLVHTKGDDDDELDMKQ